MQDFELYIHLLAFVFYFLATIIVIQFWTNVKQEKYWIGLPITLILLLIHEILEIASDFQLIDNDFIVELFEMLGALVLMISVFFLTKVLKSIDNLSIDDGS